MRFTSFGRSPMAFKEALLLISQASTSAPTIKTIVNSIGTFTLARTGAGVYTVTCAGAFTADKTFFGLQPNVSGNNIFKVERTSADVLTITTGVLTNATPATEELTNTATDALLSDTPFYICVKAN